MATHTLKSVASSDSMNVSSTSPEIGVVQAKFMDASGTKTVCTSAANAALHRKASAILKALTHLDGSVKHAVVVDYTGTVLNDVTMTIG